MDTINIPRGNTDDWRNAIVLVYGAYINTCRMRTNVRTDVIFEVLKILNNTYWKGPREKNYERQIFIGNTHIVIAFSLILEKASLLVSI